MEFEGRKVGKFWSENAGWLIVTGIIIFFLAVLVGFAVFGPPSASLSPPRFFPPLSQQEVPRFPWQKRDAITPIHWSGHHHGGHHGGGHYGYYDYHNYGYYSPYYSPYYYGNSYDYRFYPRVPWGYDGGYRGYGEEEKRPYFELHRSPNEETMRWGFQ